MQLHGVVIHLQPWHYVALLISSDSTSVHPPSKNNTRTNYPLVENSSSLYDEFFAFLLSLKPPLVTLETCDLREQALYNTGHW